MGRLRPLLSLMPLDEEVQGTGAAMLEHLNLAALQQLTAALKNHGCTSAGVLPAILGCRHRNQEAARCREAFARAGGWPTPLMVVGNPRLPDWSVHYCAVRHQLTLPVSDHYDALPQKLLWLLLTLALLKEPPTVLKMDDDAQPGELADLNHLGWELAAVDAPGAVGYPIRVPSRLSLDRGWHLGKCRSAANRQVFSSLGSREWLSGGVGYLLSRTAVNALGQYALHSWGFVKSMLYEDVCVSMLLEAADLPVQWLDAPQGLGLRNERVQEIAAGQWGACETRC